MLRAIYELVYFLHIRKSRLNIVYFTSMKNKTVIQIGIKLYTESEWRTFPITKLIQDFSLLNKFCILTKSPIIISEAV